MLVHRPHIHLFYIAADNFLEVVLCRLSLVLVIENQYSMKMQTWNLLNLIFFLLSFMPKLCYYCMLMDLQERTVKYIKSNVIFWLPNINFCAKSYKMNCPFHLLFVIQVWFEITLPSQMFPCTYCTNNKQISIKSVCHYPLSSHSTC